ncbi:MAG: 4-hydroxythreonine-4-phosphate dehydrogenase PdxA [Alphaproteobacteria bacterium]
MASSSSSAPLGITMGDPAGVGVELALKCWLARDDENLPPFVLIADPKIVAGQAEQLSLTVPLAIIDDVAQAADRFAQALPVLPVAGSNEAAQTIGAIELGTGLALSGALSGLVTLPINKHKLYEDGFAHPGHTEFLGFLCETDEAPLMMLAIPGLRTVLSTIHIPLKDVPTALAKLGPDGLVTLAERVIAALIQDFGIDQPRLAIAGLNPHAGERGSIGTEETDIIEPAIAALQHKGFVVDGPAPADTLFHETARQDYDAVLCHYHDQALIPLKTLNFHEGVNITLGLPIIRTSPDHGTAYDIAGQGIADPRSLISAIRMASQIVAARATGTTD